MANGKRYRKIVTRRKSTRLLPSWNVEHELRETYWYWSYNLRRLLIHRLSSASASTFRLYFPSHFGSTNLFATYLQQSSFQRQTESREKLRSRDILTGMWRGTSLKKNLPELATLPKSTVSKISSTAGKFSRMLTFVFLTVFQNVVQLAKSGFSWEISHFQLAK